MNCKNSQFKQLGVFSVEFALIAVFFSMLLVFSGDVIIKLSTKGKLDRLSYSLVNIIKERTALYNKNFTITQGEMNDIYTIATNSLTRSMGNFKSTNFGIRVEQQTFTAQKNDAQSVTYTDDSPITINTGSQTCSVAKSLDELTSLSVVSSRENKIALYRVTLCYETNNWFGKLVGGSYTTVSSSSVIIGR
jgi:tight adherence protein F